MFGENFYWWYSKCYEQQPVPLNWQAGRHIKWLMDKHGTPLPGWPARCQPLMLHAPKMAGRDRAGALGS